MRKGNGLLVGVMNFVKVYLVSVVAMETLWSFKVGIWEISVLWIVEWR